MTSLTCPICFDDFAAEGGRIPCFLSCGHSFCKSDLDSMAKDVRRVKCPVCRTKSKCVHAPNYVLIEALRLTKGEELDNITLSVEGDSSDGSVLAEVIETADHTIETSEEVTQQDNNSSHPSTEQQGLETSLSSSGASRRDDFKRLISSDPCNANHYYKLALSTPAQIQIKLLDGTWVTRRSLLEKTISLEPDAARGYFSLATTVCKNTAVPYKLRGKEVTKLGLYKEALKRDPHLSSAYINIALLLNAKERTTVRGHQYGKLTLLKKALALEPDNAQAYYLIAGLVCTDGSTNLFDTDMNRKQLYKKAISLDPSNPRSYNRLGSCLLTPSSSVTLLDGNKMTKVELFKKAVSLDPNFAEALTNLSNCIKVKTGTIKLDDGTVVTKDQLRSTAKSLKGRQSPCCVVS